MTQTRPQVIKIVRISSCDECPLFFTDCQVRDVVGELSNCNGPNIPDYLLTEHLIPDDCPLEDAQS